MTRQVAAVNGNWGCDVSETSWEPKDDDNGVGGPGLVGSLWRYRLVIVVVTVLAAVAGCGAALLLPSEYEAQASLYLRDPGEPAVLTLEGASPQSGDHAVFMATQAAIAGSDAVYERALQLLGRPKTPADIRQSVVVGTSADLTSITITATAGDPVEAAAVANAVGNAYQQVAGERRVDELDAVLTRLREVRAQREAELDSLTAQSPRSATLERRAMHVANLIGTLQVDEDNVAAQAALYGTGVESLQQAVPPASSSQPAPSVLALIGAVIGFLGTGVWAWWKAGRDRRVEAKGDAGAILGVPLLGETPRLSGKLRGGGGQSSALDALDALDPVAAESYHFVLASLEHALSRLGGKVVAVVSAAAGDGKTVTVLNLALAARREGRGVQLVDADERTHRLSELCDEDKHLDVIAVPRNGEESAALAVGANQNGNGAGGVKGVHPAVYFRSKSFGKLISFSGEPADLVLIDTPALLDVSEAVTIADHADAILLVVNRGTSLIDLRRARDRLAFTDTPVIGYLLNRGSARPAYTGSLVVRRLEVNRLRETQRD